MKWWVTNTTNYIIFRIFLEISKDIFLLEKKQIQKEFFF
jgi:hypothetical protein